MRKNTETIERLKTSNVEKICAAVDGKKFHTFTVLSVQFTVTLLEDEPQQRQKHNIRYLRQSRHVISAALGKLTRSHCAHLSYKCACLQMPRRLRDGRVSSPVLSNRLEK